MRTIKLVVDGQRLAIVEGAEALVSGTSGWLRCEFELDEAWDGLRVAARFFDEAGEEHAALVRDGACNVPAEVTQGVIWRVCLVGVGDYVLTTNKVAVRQERL